jgi:hypothetical protein
MLVPAPTPEVLSLSSEDVIYHYGGIALASMVVLRWIVKDAFELYDYCRKNVRRWRRRGS